MDVFTTAMRQERVLTNFAQHFEALGAGAAATDDAIALSFATSDEAAAASAALSHNILGVRTTFLPPPPAGAAPTDDAILATLQKLPDVDSAKLKTRYFDTWVEIAPTPDADRGLGHSKQQLRDLLPFSIPTSSGPASVRFALDELGTRGAF